MLNAVEALGLHGSALNISLMEVVDEEERCYGVI
jgi:hypothetical protein